MSTHLAHQLPWASLGEFIRATRSPAKGNGKIIEPTRKQLHIIYHFAKCLVGALREFAASDSRGAQVGYYNILIEGYVELNLILSDPEVFTPMVSSTNRCMSDAITGMLGYGDRPTQWFKEHIQLVLNVDRLKPARSKVLQVLRDHCAMLFRCMHSISGDNRALDVEFVTITVVSRFSITTYELYCWHYQYHPNRPLAGFFKSREYEGVYTANMNVMWA